MTDIWYCLESVQRPLLWTVLVLVLIYTAGVVHVFAICFFFSFCAFTLEKCSRDTLTNLDTWRLPRNVLFSIWDYYAKFWHGYEVIGMENVPKEGGAMLVTYHGTVPIGPMSLYARIWLEKGRLALPVTEKMLFHIPGLLSSLRLWGCLKGRAEDCERHLKAGRLVSVIPGGSREAIFGKDYQLLSGGRIGFAKVVLASKVPIIPFFTQNTREAYRLWPFVRSWCRPLYEHTKFPLYLIYGGLPVKLRTYVGKPIPYDPELTAEQLAEKAFRAIQDLIEEHQQIPGSMVSALLDRFRS